jgi:hypothetical protein
MDNRRIIAALVFGLAALGLACGSMPQQTKDTSSRETKAAAKVPNGLALSEFAGYEDWVGVGPSSTDSSNVLRMMVANPTMISAYRQGIPGNGKPFPDGSKMVKILWHQQKITTPPFSADAPDTTPGTLKELELIVKDSKRFPDTHGWGYGAFNYDAASDQLTPVSATDKPPQNNDAKCGATCHELAATTDYVFTAYSKR